MRKENLINEKIEQEASKNQMADILLHYIYIMQQDENILTIEEQGQFKECKAKDFYNVVHIDVMDIDEDNEAFAGCGYISENFIILKYADRIIKITK